MATIAADDFNGSIGGIWTTTDTGSNLSIVNNRLYVDGGLGSPVWSDPALRITSSTARSGIGGLAALVRLTNRGLFMGPGLGLQPVTNPATPAANGSGLYFDYPNLRTASGVAINPLGARMRSIDYVFTVLVRATSGFLIAVSVPTGSTGGPYPVFPLAQLLWIEDTGSGTPLYSHLANRDGYWFSDRVSLLDNTELSAALQTRYGAALGADDFTATNGTAINGRTTPTGSRTWSLLAGTATVQSNQAQLASGSTAIFNATAAPRSIQAFVTRGAGGRACLLFRGDGTTGGTWSFKGEASIVGLYDTTGGVVVQTGAVGLTQDVETHLRIIDHGSLIECFVNGVQYLSTTSTAQNTNTRVGVRAEAGQCLFNDFGAYPNQITLPTNFGSYPAIPAPTGSALSTDAFTAANGTTLPTYNAAWTVRSGSWNTQSNRAQMTAAGVQGLVTRSTGTAGVNHEARADITLPSTTPTYPVDWFPAVFCRWTDSSNYLMARFLYQDTSNEVELWERAAGVDALIGYVNLGVSALAPSSTHNLRLAVNGIECSAWLDGEVVVQATTAVLTGSNAGIGVIDNLPSGQPAWDNFEIRATSALDVTPPVISLQSSNTPGANSATITWTTDEPADSQVNYGTTAGYGTTTTLADVVSKVTTHSVLLNPLLPSTLYHYQILSRDAAGNLATDTPDRTFTTAAAGGATFSGVAVQSVSSTSATIVCTTSVAATCRVEYGATAGYGTNTAETPLSTTHSITITGLPPLQLQHWRLRATT